MPKNVKLLLILFLTSLFNDAICMESYTLNSPNAKISVSFWLTSVGEPIYSVSHSGSTILNQSKFRNC